MAAKAILMEQLKQILRLQSDGFSINAIVRHTGISWPTIKKYLSRAQNAVIDDSDAPSLSDKQLSEAVYNNDTAPARGDPVISLVSGLVTNHFTTRHTIKTHQILPAPLLRGTDNHATQKSIPKSLT